MTEIKAGNCYMCLEDIKGYDSFTKGKVYPSLYNNALINDNHIEVLVRPSDYFRIATKQEIIAQKGNSMTKQETIQVLQSIEDRAIRFPNMTECDWVAIASAKRHLQEEPVIEDLEEEIKTCFLNNTCKVSGTSVCSFSVFGRIARHFAQWQKEQMMRNAVDGRVIFEHGNLKIEHPSFFGVTHTSIPDMSGFVDGDKVKIIIVKED